MENIFSKDFFISSFDLNPRGEARLTTLANFFQEMAYHHANQLGFGYRDMNERHTMWVLSRIRIRIDRYPVWDDRVSVSTWHKGMDRLFGLRDFRVKNDAGEVLGVASSAWLILDSQTKRPVRPGRDVLHHRQGNESVFEEELEKITLPDPMEMSSTRQVQFSDLDIVGHVNNVKYMEWSIDALISNNSNIKEIRELEINFTGEALLGDLVEICCKDSFFVANRAGDGREIFRARMEWE